MKICILTPRFPYPQYGGDTLRINEIAKYIKKQGHQLILVSMSDEKSPDLETALTLYDKVQYVVRKPWQSMLFSLIYFILRRPMQCGYYHSSKYYSLIKKVTEEEKPDMYICHLLRLVPYLEKLGVEDKSIIEMTDTLSKTYALSSSAKSKRLLKYVYLFEQKLIRNYEMRTAKKFKKVVLVSKEDADYLKQQDATLANHIYVHTNGVYLSDKQNTNYNPNKICFIGNMRSLQNQDAVMFFVNEVFPIIKNHNPDCKFHIVGSLPPKSIQDLASESIIVTGFVEDLHEYISDSCCNIAPVRVAAGIQNKVLVSMSCGIPTIMSSIISKGIVGLKNGENCYIVNSAEDYANKCIELMHNEDLRNYIGNNGYEFVKHSYQWEECLKGYI